MEKESTKVGRLEPGGLDDKQKKNKRKKKFDYIEERNRDFYTAGFFANPITSWAVAVKVILPSKKKSLD